MMANDGDSHEKYSRMECYRNGRLWSEANCPEPHGLDWGGIIGTLIALILIGFVALTLMH
jgi:hypothetical protein